MSSLFSTLSVWTDRILGLHIPPGELGFGHMAARSVAVFIVGLALVRMGDRRLLGRNATIDVLLVVVLGSVLSRAINGQAAFFPTLFACALLVFCHHFTAKLACRWSWFSSLVKGRPQVMIRGGRVDADELRRANMTPEDLEENLRINGSVADTSAVKEARLERNGIISVIPEEKKD